MLCHNMHQMGAVPFAFDMYLPFISVFTMNTNINMDRSNQIEKK